MDKEKNIIVILFSLSIPFLIFIFFPLSFVFDNISEIQETNFISIYKNSLSNFFILSILIALILLIANKANQKIFNSLIFFLKFKILILILLGLYLPLRSGLFLQEQLIFSKTNLIISIFIAFALILLNLYLIKNFSRIIFILLIGPIFVLLFNIIQNNQSTFFSSKDQKLEFIPFSSNQNIIIISFDALQGDVMKSAIQGNSEHFEGFTFFENAVAPAPYTTHSLLAQKSTSLNNEDSIFKYLAKPKQNKKKIKFYKDNFITSKFKKNNFSIETYGSFGKYETAGTNQLKSLSKNNFNYIFKISSLRYDFYNLYNNLNKHLTKIYSKNIKKKNNRIFDNPLKNSINDYNSFLNTTSVKETKPTLRLHHYAFTHDPVLFESDCSYNPDKKKNRYEYQLKEANCATKKIIEFLRILKKYKIFDNSTIIFQSDHGRECVYDNPNKIKNFNVADLECNNRYQTFLMLKKEFTKKNKLNYDSRMVTNTDITFTLCRYYLDKSSCDNFIGTDLFSIQSSEDPIRTMLYTNKGEGKKILEIDRNINIENQFKDLTYTFKFNSTNRNIYFTKKNLLFDNFLFLPFQKSGLRSYGPKLNLIEGKYSLILNYKNIVLFKNNNTYFEISLDGDLIHKELFNSNSKNETIDFSCKNTICKNFEVKTYYDGGSIFKLEKIVLKKI